MRGNAEWPNMKRLYRLGKDRVLTAPLFQRIEILELFKKHLEFFSNIFTVNLNHVDRNFNKK